MKSYTYLLIDILTIIVCFIASFDTRIKFNQHFGTFLKAAFITAVPFIAWDIWFTKMGVWWFNTDYTLGLNLLGLPLEEWLFFFCIPFSCVFTYFCLDKFFNLNWANKYDTFLGWATIIICLAIAISFYDKLYPLVTAVMAFSTMIFLQFIAKVDWIAKASFAFLLLMPGFFLVNGVLTGTGLKSPIVNYNPQEILNIRLLTIPIEDSVYGYAQFLIVIYFFKKLKSVSYEKL